MSIFGDGCVVEELLLKVSIPVDAEVDADAGEASVVVGDTADGGVVTRHGHGAVVVVAEVASAGATVVGGADGAVVDLAGGGVAIVVVWFVLVASKEFETRDIGVEVGDVMSVAVAETSGGETFATVVDDHGAEDDLVAPIDVDIGNGVVMITLAVPYAGGVADPVPTC